MKHSDRITVVAEYHEFPAEGINVVSKTLIDDLRRMGRDVKVVPPANLLMRLPQLLLDKSGLTVFTHGPGPRTVLVSLILRRMTDKRVLWLATRPDLSRCPACLAGRPTAHVVICNRKREDLTSTALGAIMIEHPIGIAPERLSVSGNNRWPEIRARGVPIAIHVGHVRRNRGLDQLIDIKKRLGPRIEIVLIASPYFEPDASILADLLACGVQVDTGFVESIADVYASADLYLFPAPPESEGAIELPLSVLEAIASGKPVVTTSFGALPSALAGIAGVHFADQARFAATVEGLVLDGFVERPKGLPHNLNAHRLAELIIEISEKI